MQNLVESARVRTIMTTDLIKQIVLFDTALVFNQSCLLTN